MGRTECVHGRVEKERGVLEQKVAVGRANRRLAHAALEPLGRVAHRRVVNGVERSSGVQMAAGGRDRRRRRREHLHAIVQMNVIVFRCVDRQLIAVPARLNVVHDRGVVTAMVR